MAAACLKIQLSRVCILGSCHARSMSTPVGSCHRQYRRSTTQTCNRVLHTRAWVTVPRWDTAGSHSGSPLHVCSLPAYMPVQFGRSSIRKFNPAVGRAKSSRTLEIQTLVDATMTDTTVTDTTVTDYPSTQKENAFMSSLKRQLRITDLQLDFIMSKLTSYWEQIDKDNVLDTVDQDYFSHGDSENLIENTLLNDQFWEEFEADIRQRIPKLRQAIHYPLLQLIDSLNKPPLAVLLMKYIRRKHGEPSRIIVASFIEICATDFPEIACQELDKLLATKTIPIHIIKPLLKGFANTKNWMKCVEVIDKAEKDKVPYKAVTIIPLLRRLLIDNDLAAFHTHYTRASVIHPESSKTGALEADIFNLWLSGEIPLRRLLDVVCKCGIYLDEVQATTILQAINEENGQVVNGEKYFARLAYVRDGCCTKCTKEIPEDSLTQEDIDHLRRGFYDRFLSDEKYISNRSIMLSKFRDFIRKSPKFTVVIDLLNIISFYGDYMTGDARFKATLRILEGETTLAVGQSNKFVSMCEKDGCHYFAGGISDDLIVLLAALYSGLDTCILSNDQYRDYRKVFDSDTQAVFIKWQKCRQIAHHPHQEVHSLMFPYNMIADKHEHGWHIPYVTKPTEHAIPYVKKPTELPQFFAPRTLLCVTKGKR